MLTHQLKLAKPLAIFDLETTGTNILKDRIIEMAIMKALPDGSVEEYYQVVNPGIPIPAQSAAVHGFKDQDVADKPPFEEVAHEVEQFLEGCDLGGYNAIKFDIPVLAEELARADIDLHIEKRRLIDAQRIFFAMEKRTLSAAYQFFCDKDLNELGQGAHSARTDTQATLEILDAQVQRYEGKAVKDNLENELGTIKNDVATLHKLFNNNMVDLAGRMVFNNQGDIVFNFGKNRGVKVEEVLKKQPQYYDWMMRNDFPIDTKNWLTKIKLSMAMK